MHLRSTFLELPIYQRYWTASDHTALCSVHASNIQGSVQVHAQVRESLLRGRKKKNGYVYMCFLKKVLLAQHLSITLQVNCLLSNLNLPSPL
jgi:hypothetical protein